jgi:Ni/Fe-hydrogenase subunit HybB-like protein
MWDWILALLLTAGVYAGYLRQVHGWGSVESLRNVFPWGLASGLNVFCGQALTAGALTVAVVIYGFDLRSYRSVLRLSLLAGFLGFLVAILTLCVNRPVSVRVALALWNRHSAVVGMVWSVAIYALLLMVEFAPDLSRRWRRGVPAWTGRLMALPLAIFAWALANLQQAALTDLLAGARQDFSPLWASPRLPFLFFLSAVFACLAVIIFSSAVLRRHIGRGLSPVQVAELGRVMGIVLFMYLVVRAANYVERGVWPLLFGFRGENYLLGLELSLLLLALLLLGRRELNDPRRLYLSAVLTIAGVIANRLNTSITAREAVAGVAYRIHWTEVAIAYGIMALGIATFAATVSRLPVLGDGRGRSFA